MQRHSERSSGLDGRLRFGVCGTGHWADTVHLPALAAMPDVELVGLWGRNPERAAALGARHGTRVFEGFEALLDEADAIAFAVPPEVQAGLALRAAIAGKHLLLEKPVATDLEAADELVEAVEGRGLASVVFLTRLFVDEIVRFIGEARASRPDAAEGGFRSGNLLPGTPYSGSVWRQADYGTLWDIGPHVLSVLVSVLGPVVAIGAERVREGRFACEMGHASGARSSMLLDLKDPTVRGIAEHYRFGSEANGIAGGGFKYDRQHVYANAVRALAEHVATGRRTDRPDVGFGRDLVAVLAAARRSVESGGSVIAVAETTHA